ncbi:MAG: hypothetical protein ACI9OJ_002859, partial [Myxococcota bacterium]
MPFRTKFSVAVALVLVANLTSCSAESDAGDTGPSAQQSSITMELSELPAGEWADATIFVRNAAGAPIPQASLVATGSASLSIRPIGPTDAAGTTTVAVSSTRAAEHTLTIYLEGSQNELVSANFSVVGGAADRAIIVAPAAAIAGRLLEPPVTVRLEDPFGNVAQDAEVVLSLTNDSTGLVGDTTAQSLNGLATLNVSLETAGEHTIRATSGDVVGESVHPVVVTADDGTRLSFLEIEPAPAGVPMTPIQVDVVDEFGNRTDKTADVILSLESGPEGGTLTGGLTKSAIEGRAIFDDLVVNKPGETWVIRANSSGVATATATFTSLEFQSLSGTITYEHPKPTLDGLLLDNPDILPVRRVRLDIVDANGADLATTYTDGEGAYSAEWSGPDSVTLRIRAQSREPKITVRDNTAEDAVYVRTYDNVETGIFDVLIPSGATFGVYDDEMDRPAAPFAILGAMVKCADAFVAAGATLPSLMVNWSPLNTAWSGSKALGAIGTSHYFEGEIWILGDAGVDHDEFDRHVVSHEWGHYLEGLFGREDGIGGGHSIGDALDPRIAFSEGFATAVSAMVHHPDTDYVDCHGWMGESCFLVSVTDNSEDTNPGWFSEHSVLSILYDLFDDGDDEAFDKVSIGVSGIFDILAGPSAHTEALVTVFSFLHGAKTLFPEHTAGIDELGEMHGIDPVKNDYG